MRFFNSADILYRTDIFYPWQSSELAEVTALFRIKWRFSEICSGHTTYDIAARASAAQVDRNAQPDGSMARSARTKEGHAITTTGEMAGGEAVQLSYPLPRRRVNVAQALA